jgi:transposase
LYRIALVQIRHPSPGQAYYRKRRDANDPPAEALRRLKRRIARTVFARLQADYANRPAMPDQFPSFPELERINAEWSGALADLGVAATTLTG